MWFGRTVANNQGSGAKSACFGPKKRVPDPVSHLVFAPYRGPKRSETDFPEVVFVRKCDDVDENRGTPPTGDVLASWL